MNMRSRDLRGELFSVEMDLYYTFLSTKYEYEEQIFEWSVVFSGNGQQEAMC